MTYVDFGIYDNKTKRNYLGRATKDWPDISNIARKFDFDYWDGDRKYGYGGYEYDGRWKPIAEKLISHYKLNGESSVLEIGCGKGYLLYELKQLIPELNIQGVDISEYAIENSKEEIKEYLQVGNAKKLPFEDNSFDLILSLGVLYNLCMYELKDAIQEIERVGKKKYITMESYRNSKEKFNLLCWAITIKTYLSDKEWKWILKEFGYTGDYCLFYFD